MLNESHIEPVLYIKHTILEAILLHSTKNVIVLSNGERGWEHIHIEDYGFNSEKTGL